MTGQESFSNDDSRSQCCSLSSHHLRGIEVTLDAACRLDDEEAADAYLSIDPAGHNQLFSIDLPFDDPGLTDLQQIVGVDLPSEDTIHPDASFEGQIALVGRTSPKKSVEVPMILAHFLVTAELGDQPIEIV